MPDTITADEMRALEQAAIDSGKVTGLELMERAGQGVVEAIFEEWPELAEGPHKAVVLCGPGNNGGDGFVVARLLRKLGWDVTVFTLGSMANLPPDAKANFDRWDEADYWYDLTEWQEFDNPEPIAYMSSSNDVLIDALFGIGLSRQVKYPLEEVVPEISKAIRKVAIDVPSGIDADSGTVIGKAERDGFRRCIPADLTITFHAMKPGHILGKKPNYCGKTVVKDIGL